MRSVAALKEHRGLQHKVQAPQQRTSLLDVAAGKKHVLLITVSQPIPPHLLKSGDHVLPVVLNRLVLSHAEDGVQDRPLQCVVAYDLQVV